MVNQRMKRTQKLQAAARLALKEIEPHDGRLSREAFVAVRQVLRDALKEPLDTP